MMEMIMNRNYGFFGEPGFVGENNLKYRDEGTLDGGDVHEANVFSEDSDASELDFSDEEA